MKLNVALICFAFAASAFTGCQTVSPAEIKVAADQIGYGSELSPDWQDHVKAFMETRLKDSASAVYKFRDNQVVRWKSDGVWAPSP